MSKPRDEHASTHVTDSHVSTPRSPISDLAIPLRWRDDTYPFALDNGEHLLGSAIADEYEKALAHPRVGGIRGWVILTPEEEEQLSRRSSLADLLGF